MSDLDPAALAAIRADAASHQRRPQPYCTSCVEDIAQLCDEIERLRAERARVEEVLDAYRDLVPERPTCKEYGPNYGTPLPGKQWDLGAWDVCVMVRKAMATR